MPIKSRLFHTTGQAGIMFESIRAKPLAVRASTYSTQGTSTYQAPKSLLQRKAYFSEDFVRPVYKYRGATDKMLLAITTVGLILTTLESLRVVYLLGWKKR